MPNNENFVDKAEKTVKTLLQPKNPKTGRPIPIVTTSKIRNLLGMTADLYNEVRLLRSAELDAEFKERLSYLRVRCLYEAGRDESVRQFVEKSEILTMLAGIKTKADYINFSHYMEALVAWRKYLGERDD